LLLYRVTKKSSFRCRSEKVSTAQHDVTLTALG
jgi:hypothetical protein